MSVMFYLLAGMTAIGALASMSLRNPVHCALCLVVTFVGLAGIYLGLGAQFLGLAQVMVYVGAVAILLVFVLLLTRSLGDSGNPESLPAWKSAVGISVLVAGVMVFGVLSVDRWELRAKAPEPVPVAAVGRALMTEYVLPLQIVGVLLTAAMIGAAVLAIPEKRVNSRGKSGHPGAVDRSEKGGAA